MKPLYLLLLGLAWTAAADNTFIYNDSDATMQFYVRYVSLSSPCAGEGQGGLNTIAPHSMTSWTSTGNFEWAAYFPNSPCTNGNGNLTLVNSYPGGCGYSYYLGFGPWTSAGITFHFACSNWTCRTIYFYNADSVPRTFLVNSNNAANGSLLHPPTIAVVELLPTQYYSNTICGPDNFYLTACRVPIGGNGTDGLPCDATIFDHATPPSLPDKQNNSKTNQLAAPDYDGSTTNIAWSGNPTNVAHDETLKSGFSAVFDVSSKFATQTKLGLDQLHEDNLRQENDLLSLSNLLNGIYNKTNFSGDWSSYLTNKQNVTSGNMGHLTNVTLADGQAALGEAWTKAGDVETAVGSAPTVTSPGASGDFWTLHDFPTVGALVLNPVANYSGAFSIIRQTIGWVATLMFLMWCGERYMKLAHTFATAETGGVPNFMAEVFGVGGNIAGIIAAVVVTVIFIGLWVGAFVWLFDALLAWLSGGFWTVNPWDGWGSFTYGGQGVGGQAIYLLDSFMPLSYILSLLWSRVSIGFAIPKLVLAAAAASRFLAGK